MVAMAISFQILTWRGVDAMKALLIVAALAIAAGNTRGLRPQVLSLLLMNLLLMALVAHRRRPGAWLTAALALLFLFWAQVHAACVMGLAVAGVWTSGRAVDGLRAALVRRKASQPPSGRASGGREVLMLASALAAAVLAVLITPLAITHYEYVRLTMDLAFLRTYVAEWQPPRLFPPAIPDLYHYLLAVAIAAAMARWRLRRRPQTPENMTAAPPPRPCGDDNIDIAPVAVAAFTLAVGFTATRHIPLACIGCVPLLGDLLRRNASESAGGAATASGTRSLLPRWTRRDLRGIALCWAIVVAVLAGFWRFPTSVEQRYAAAEPVQGTAALKALGIPLRVFTTYDTGAFVIWSAPGRLRVFVDSRADVYGDDLLHKGHAAAAGYEWKALFAEWNVQAAVLGRADRLAAILAKEPGWTLLAGDEDSVTFLSAAIRPRVASAMPKGHERPSCFPQSDPSGWQFREHIHLPMLRGYTHERDRQERPLRCSTGR